MSLFEESIDLLSRLEREETSLLAWGIVDGGFSRGELEDRAAEFAATDQSCQAAGYLGEDLLDPLLDRHLLLAFPSSEGPIFRTRMAETIRLLARLRQLFPDDLRQGTWFSAPVLVADYRFSIRGRRYPLRNVPPKVVVKEVGDVVSLGNHERDVLLRLASFGPRASGLSSFQVVATCRILAASQRGRTAGVVVAAGTGTGKTLAFYLPAFTLITSLIDNSHWSKVVAMYPRVELLKDQCSEAAVEARRASDVLRRAGKRVIMLGALYGETPRTPEEATRIWQSRPGGYICPYLRCPDCEGLLIWREDDLKASRERLHCTAASCSGQLSEDEVVLTRKRMRTQQPDLLLTTTEMVNRCLASSSDRPLIGISGPGTMRPRLVLLDEVHTYNGTSGAQNALVLRRWRYAMGRQPVFVGLSATLRDARRFFAEVTGLGEHEVVVVEPSQADLIEEGMEYSVAVRSDPTSGAALLATTIQSAMLLRRMLDPRGSASRPRISAERLFAFTDNLDVTNRLYWALQHAEGWDEFGRPRPFSTQRPARSLAALRSPHLPDHAARFNLGQSWDACVEIGHSLSDDAQLRIDRTSSQDVSYSANCDIVVTTSSLDVGLDDPTVGAVIQHKAPRESAQFVQRRGRAGRERGTRPWTAVVLSDVGRDRIAYEEYEKLFDPELQSQSLPVRNRYVLRMQAAFATMDWLTVRLPGVRNLRKDLSGPGDESGQWAQANARSRREVAVLIAKTLDDKGLQGELAAYIKLALRISDDDVDALLFYPPRAILTSVLPTALRRLTTGWRRVDGTGGKEPFGDNPLPEFIPANLFSDLLLPEVGIVVPPARQGEEATTEPMTITQALQEFAPGRASRRYAVEHGHQRHWSPIPEGLATAVVPIDTYCDGDRVGTLRFVDDGHEQDFVCVRPWTIPTEKLPAGLRDTSNARPIWRTKVASIRFDDEGNVLDIPQTSSWAKALRAITAFTHELGSGLAVHRYSLGSDAILLGRSGSAQRVHVRFSDAKDEDAKPAAVGLSMEVDGLAIRFRQPSSAAVERVGEGIRSRAFRVSLFRHLIETDSTLSGIANDFQLARLQEGALGALLREALASGKSMSDIHSSWSLSQLQTRIVSEITGEGGAAYPGAEAVDESENPDDDDTPRRIAELIELCKRDDVAGRLQDLMPALWSAPDSRWTDWYRARYAATLGAAFVDACYRLCPESGREELALDLEQGDEDEGLLWITETVPGGAGVIQSVIETYAQDPRRFFHLVEAALGPSEQEVVSNTLESVVAQLEAGSGRLEASVDEVRKAWTGGLEPLGKAFTTLIDNLRAEAIPTTHGVVSALNARILRPGSGPETDKLLGHLLKAWVDIEGGLGIEVDLRQFASWVVDSPRVVEMMNRLPGARGHERPWRVSIVTGLLWPRGTVLRARALDASHRFATHPPADWELVRDALGPQAPVIEMAASDWTMQLDEALLQNGAATLHATGSNAVGLKRALLGCLARPIDAGYLFLFPRLVGWLRTPNGVEVTLELREALQ